MAAARRRKPFDDEVPEADAGDRSALPARRYSDEEVRTILRRATEEELRPAPHTRRTAGLSLEQLEAVAAEAGIDPGAVRRSALSTLPPPPRSAVDRVVGGPARRRHDVFLPGRLPAERHRALEESLEALFEREMEKVGGDGWVCWKEGHVQGRTVVSLREEPDGVVVRLDADRSGWLALSVLGTAAAAVILTPVVLPLLWGLPGGPLLFIAAMGAGVLGGVRLLWSRASSRLHRQLERAVAVVMEHLEEAGADRLPPGTASP